MNKFNILILVMVPVVSFANIMFPPPPVFNIEVIAKNNSDHFFGYTREKPKARACIDPGAKGVIKEEMRMCSKNEITFLDIDNGNNYCVVKYRNNGIYEVDNFGKANCQKLHQHYLSLFPMSIELKE